MKTTFLVLCLFHFAYKGTSFDILDTDKHPVENAASAYYLVPVSPKYNGGLGLATVGNEAEPKAVVLDPNNSPGLPVRFVSPLLLPYISQSMYLNIVFPSISSDEATWDVSAEFPIGWAVRISDTKTFFGPFRVEKAGKGYKIVYYLNNGETGRELGLVYQKGKYRLAVRDGEPFIFHIKKATEDENSAGIMSMV